MTVVYANSCWFTVNNYHYSLRSRTAKIIDAQVQVIDARKSPLDENSLNRFPSRDFMNVLIVQTLSSVPEIGNSDESIRKQHELTSKPYSPLNAERKTSLLQKTDNGESQRAQHQFILVPCSPTCKTMNTRNAELKQQPPWREESFINLCTNITIAL